MVLHDACVGFPLQTSTAASTQTLLCCDTPTANNKQRTRLGDVCLPQALLYSHAATPFLCVRFIGMMHVEALSL